MAVIINDFEVVAGPGAREDGEAAQPEPEQPGRDPGTLAPSDIESIHHHLAYREMRIRAH